VSDACRRAGVSLLRFRCVLEPDGDAGAIGLEAPSEAATSAR
jgi:hypothetical protein